MSTTSIDKLPQKQLAKMAINMRRRARNEAMNKQLMVRRILNVGVGSGAAWAMGKYMGTKQKEYLAIADEVVAKTKEDPRQVAGVDLEIWIGGAASLGGVALQGKSATRFYGELAESAGLGVLCFYAGKKGFDDEMKTGPGPFAGAGTP